MKRFANAPLVGQIAFTNGGVQRMVTSKTYDNLNRLTQIASAPSASSAVTFTYAYNSANQRTAVTNADSSRWAYGYDALGQVTSGKKYWNDATPVAGQQFEYSFDDIGNRKVTASGGDQYGLNLRSAGYTNNALNQITSRGVPGYVDVLGEATNTATVTVNDQLAYRHGEYFRAELGANNASSPLWFGVTNLAVLNDGTNANLIASSTGFVFVAQSPEAFNYDADGNLTNDGRWVFTWDAENRLVNMTSLSSGPAGSKLKLEFSYDSRSRRIEKIVSTWNGSSYDAESTNRFVYDGWNLIAILDPQSSILQSFMWGLDLSGTMQGAGGVGGLLAVNDSANGTHFCAYDGNGNVTALVKATDGTVSANYEYGPFGEVLRATGLMAKENAFLFSTKFYDWEAGLYYYGYRYYDPITGRWLGHDPIGEVGGLNQYAFIVNDPVRFFDAVGLYNPIIGPNGTPVGNGNGFPDAGLFYPHLQRPLAVIIQPIAGTPKSCLEFAFDLFAGGSGEISQPAYAGSLTFTQFPAGMSSELKIRGFPWLLAPGGCCNTVTGNEGEKGSGGFVFSLTGPPGIYQVAIHATFRAEGSGPNGRATVEVVDSTGATIFKRAGTTKQPYHDSFRIVRNVRLDPTGAAKFMIYRPSIGISDCCSSGRAIGQFEVVSVEQIGEK